MGLLSLITAILALLSTLWLQNESATIRNAESTETAAIVGNMMVYRNAVSQYAHNHPDVVDAVPDSLLELPTWYQRISGVHNYLDNGTGYVYFSSTRPELAYQLIKASHNSINIGINKGGVLVSPLSETNYSIPITLPSAIPVGSVVYTF